MVLGLVRVRPYKRLQVSWYKRLWANGIYLLLLAKMPPPYRLSKKHDFCDAAWCYQSAGSPNVQSHRPATIKSDESSGLWRDLNVTLTTTFGLMIGFYLYV
ncbi:hypothetical protein M8C21_017906 [Ambrosia artemisiifolia]|uniref:Uncharacterized protein n=1 Tax=Ambrosia artemisiifolia TaxID=4212 RepID=A0AAD5G9A6_AMBAR|nr:hypothetical protein M8C21_017906 [Ambrosia artemisiifolia]